VSRKLMINELRGMQYGIRRKAHNLEVGGSNPSPATKLRNKNEF